MMPNALTWFLLVALLVENRALAQAETEIVIPAATAYLEAVQNADETDRAHAEVRPVLGRSRVRVAKEGIVGFGDPEISAAWYGKIDKASTFEVIVRFAQPTEQQARFRLQCAEQVVSCDVPRGGTQVYFPGISIVTTGNQALRLFSETETRVAIKELALVGPAVAGCHFNLKPRRNAASVHLRYPQSNGQKVAAFYCEMTAIDDPVWSYYMACGWHRGYFGMQVNSESERRIIFSVWDSGNEGVDRKKVDAADRVQLVAKGEGVYSGDFGNEGTGGHSHLKFNWKTGKRQRFLVTATPTDATHTVYAGYYFRNDLKGWMLISSWKAPHEGGYMKGLYSFSENFVGQNGQLRRKALYGNQWIQTPDEVWTELTDASFSHDVTGRADRFDRFMGVEAGDFFLSHGYVAPHGLSNGFTKFNATFSRPATGNPPEVKLPE